MRKTEFSVRPAEKKVKKIAVCPGSFDPVTLGHMDIIKRTSAIFDEVIVLVSFNPAKTQTGFTPDERVNMLRRCTKDLPNVRIDSSAGLLADYCAENNVTAVVKGLRAVSDFEYEFQQALINQKLNGKTETVFIPSASENTYISSSVVKQLCAFGADISTFVPEEILDEILERLSK